MKKKIPPYDELFQRNQGVFSNKEIKRIKTLRVAIIGAGGLGGYVAYTLARLGVGKIKLVDPEKFEPSNINRQFGAYIDTIGQQKSLAIQKELLRINPYVEVYADASPLLVSDVARFINDVDLVVDAIDFFAVDIERKVYQRAKQNGIWCHTAQAAANIVTFTSFNPKGMSFDEILKDGKGDINIVNLIKIFFPILPSKATPELLSDAISGKLTHISSHATTPPIAGGIVVENIIRTHVREDAPYAEAPELLILDLHNLSTKITKMKNTK